MQSGRPTVLIVDDEETIRNLLTVELEERYLVASAADANEAFAILAEKPVDLIISDINMPGIKGYDLLGKAKKRYPHLKTALMTGCDVDEYIRLAKENDISNIISKSIPFNLEEFNSIVDGLITEEIFGLERYMRPDFSLIETYVLNGSAQIATIEQSIMNHISTFHRLQLFVQILLEEIITNAIYHGPTDDTGKTKYEKHTRVILAKGEEVVVRLGKDSEKYGVSVMDGCGRLSKKTVLFHIDRQVGGEGILDEKGRGIHMSRMYADRLIINIRKGSATEVIFLNYYDKKYRGYKPLYINEI